MKTLSIRNVAISLTRRKPCPPKATVFSFLFAMMTERSKAKISMRTLSGLRARAGAFFRNTGGNVAIIMALSAIPLTLAMGAGIDYARGLAVHSNMTDALDAAGLAVGAATTKPSS